jgi:hypothetical protein
MGQMYKYDSDSDSSDFCEYQKTCFFSENIFICSRENGDGNFSIEVHEIHSEGGILLRKIELHPNSERPFDNLFIESIKNSSWNFYISTSRSRETFIIFYDEIQNLVNSKLEKEPLPEIPPPHPSGLPVRILMKRYFTDGELDKAVKRVEKKLESEVNVYGHVRFSVEYDLDTDKTTAYVSLQCYESLQIVFLVQVLRIRKKFHKLFTCYRKNLHKDKVIKKCTYNCHFESLIDNKNNILINLKSQTIQSPANRKCFVSFFAF